MYGECAAVVSAGVGDAVGIQIQWELKCVADRVDVVSVQFNLHCRAYRATVVVQKATATATAWAATISIHSKAFYNGINTNFPQYTIEYYVGIGHVSISVTKEHDWQWTWQW